MKLLLICKTVFCLKLNKFMGSIKLITVTYCRFYGKSEDICNIGTNQGTYIVCRLFS